MNKAITCTVPSVNKAEEVLNRLQLEGFSSSDISLLFAQNDKNKVVIEKHSKASEGAATGVGTGGVLGGVLGWLAGIGSLAIPGIGPFIAAGPIMAALSGGAIGAAVGGFIGSLVGVGIPELEAKNYENKLKQGHALISVRVLNEEQDKKVKEIFKSNQAEDISDTKEIAA